MKRRDLLKKIRQMAKEAGLDVELSEGGNHSKIGIGNQKTPLPSHNEIGERLAKEILQQAQEMIELAKKDKK